MGIFYSCTARSRWETLFNISWLVFSGGVAYRQAYTGELANQIRQAYAWISVHDMHSEAVNNMRKKYGSEQTPVYMDLLDRKLCMPGKV